MHRLTCALFCDWVQVMRSSTNSRQITVAAVGRGKALFANTAIVITTIHTPSQSILSASCKHGNRRCQWILTHCQGHDMNMKHKPCMHAYILINENKFGSDLTQSLNNYDVCLVYTDMHTHAHKNNSTTQSYIKDSLHLLDSTQSACLHPLQPSMASFSIS